MHAEHLIKAMEVMSGGGAMYKGHLPPDCREPVFRLMMILGPLHPCQWLHGKGRCVMLTNLLQLQNVRLPV